MWVSVKKTKIACLGGCKRNDENRGVEKVISNSSSLRRNIQQYYLYGFIYVRARVWNTNLRTIVAKKRCVYHRRDNNLRALKMGTVWNHEISPKIQLLQTSFCRRLKSKKGRKGIEFGIFKRHIPVEREIGEKLERNKDTIDVITRYNKRLAWIDEFAFGHPMYIWRGE